MKRTAKTLLGLSLYLLLSLFYGLPLEITIFLMYLVSLYIALLLYTSTIHVEVISLIPPTRTNEGRVSIKIKNNFLPITILVEPLIIGKIQSERHLVSLGPNEEKIVDLNIIGEKHSILLGFKIYPFAFPILDYSVVTLEKPIIITSSVRISLNELKKKLGSLFGGEFIHKRKTNEGFEFYGIEKYTGGPARYINWKKSAQYNELYTNVFHLEGHRKVLIGIINSVINLEHWEKLEATLRAAIKAFEKDRVYIMLIDSLGTIVVTPSKIHTLLKTSLPIRDFHPKIKKKINKVKEKLEKEYNLDLTDEEVLLLGLVSDILPFSYKVSIEPFATAKADIKILITTKDYPIELPNVKTIIV